MTKLEHPVPSDMLRAIGDMTVSFALLEMTIQDLVGWFISGHQRIGQIVTSEAAFPRLLNMARALYIDQHGRDGHYQDLDALLREAENAYSQRNLVTHSIWATGSTLDSAMRVKFSARDKKGFTATFKEMDAHGVHEQAEGFKALAYRVQMFWISLFDAGKQPGGPSVVS